MKLGHSDLLLLKPTIKLGHNDLLYSGLDGISAAIQMSLTSAPHPTNYITVCIHAADKHIIF